MPEPSVTPSGMLLFRGSPTTLHGTYPSSARPQQDLDGVGQPGELDYVWASCSHPGRGPHTWGSCPGASSEPLKPASLSQDPCFSSAPDYGASFIHPARSSQDLTTWQNPCQAPGHHEDPEKT